MDPEVAEFGRLLHLKKGGGTDRSVRVASVHEPPAVIHNLRLYHGLQNTASHIDVQKRVFLKDLDQGERQLRSSLQKIRNRERNINKERSSNNQHDQMDDLILSKSQILSLKKTSKVNTRSFLPPIPASPFLVTGGFTRHYPGEDCPGARAQRRNRSITIGQMENISEKVESSHVTEPVDEEVPCRERRGSISQSRTKYI